MRGEWTRPALVALALCGLATTAEARRSKIEQRALPAWVTAELGELSGVATVSREGGSEILFHELAVRPLTDGRVAYRLREVRRLHDERGLRAAVNVLLVRESDEVELQDSWCVHPDGRVTGPDRRQRPSEVPYSTGGVTISDHVLRVVELPLVRVGATVVHEQAWIRSLDLGGTSFALGDTEVRVGKARLRVEPPEGFRVLHQLENGEELQLVETPRALVVEGADLSPPRREDFDPSLRELVPRAWVSWNDSRGRGGFENWSDVALWFHGLESESLAQRGASTRMCKEMAPGTEAELLAAIRTAHLHAACEIRYTAIELGIGGWKPASPQQTLERRHGDCKAKASLFRSLTLDWPGVRSFMVSVRTRTLGELPLETPQAGAFNHAIAAVALPEGVGAGLWATAEVEGLGRLLFLDPTSRHGDPFHLPWADQGTWALVGHEGGGALVELPVQPPEAHVTTSVLKARIDDEGELLHAELEETFEGGAAAWIREVLAPLDDRGRRQLLVDDLADNIPLARVEDYRALGLDDLELPVQERSSFSGGRLGQRLQGLLVVELGSSLRPFLDGVLTRETMAFDLRLGRPSTRTAMAEVSIPEGWVPESLPAPLEIENDHLRVQARWSHRDGKLRYSRTGKITNHRVPPSDYLLVKKAVEAIQRSDRGAVVLVPKG